MSLGRRGGDGGVIEVHPSAQMSDMCMTNEPTKNMSMECLRR